MNQEKPKVNFKFERIEKKFWMSKEQYEGILPTLQKYMEVDSYGESQICNIYYDTADYALIRKSIERPFFKEKLRLRSYGFPSAEDKVFVEIKRKLDGIGYKRRISLPFKDAVALLEGKQSCPNPSQIEKEILEFVKRYKPGPRVQLTYIRYAMAGREDPELRITIDKNIRYRICNNAAFSDSGTAPVLEDESRVLMEIKAFGAIPWWLVNEMSRLKIYQAPFSKIGTCYTNHIAGNSKGIKKC